MRHLSSAAYAHASAAIDAANAGDPALVEVDGASVPLALAHGELAARWVERLVPDASEPLRLAARAHHLRRWEVPRSTYPEGRAGYLRWRRDQKARHARDVSELLLAAGYDAAVVTRVQELVRREHLATDPEAQAVEDAACLTFLETQLTSFARRTPRAKMVEVLQKTAAKMTARGLAAAAGLALDDEGRSLLAEALGAATGEPSAHDA